MAWGGKMRIRWLEWMKIYVMWGVMILLLKFSLWAGNNPIGVLFFLSGLMVGIFAAMFLEEELKYMKSEVEE